MSTAVNHLLKAPFCVHPKTGKICVPIEAAKCEAFNPMLVPTLSQLVDELDQGIPSSLVSHIATFTLFINAMKSNVKEDSLMF